MSSGLQPKQLLSYLFIIAIAVVFILQSGPAGGGCEAPLRPTTTASAALVNGKEISLRDFNSEFNQRMQWFRLQGKPLHPLIEFAVEVAQRYLFAVHQRRRGGRRWPQRRLAPPAGRAGLKDEDHCDRDDEKVG